MPEELPEKCPVCGTSSGWHIAGRHSVRVSSDGEVDLGIGNNRRYGSKFKATCNNRDCDAAVNIYLEGEVVRTGDIESTGASELIEVVREELPAFVNQFCDRCGKTFLADVSVRRSESGGVSLRTPAYCGCGETVKQRVRDSTITKELVSIDNPDEVNQRLEELK